MKISVLTATYNRAELLKNLYNSLIQNTIYGVNLEWLIMDDGSIDNTKNIIKEFVENDFLKIKYYHQENQGKMTAINNLIKNVADDSTLLIECDSDDYFSSNAVKIISEKYEFIKNNENIYAMVFLKNDENMCNIGNLFKEDNYESTMFDLYFKDGLLGDKLLVFNSKIRTKFNYVLEKGERFTTEARLHNELDKKYKVVCFNTPVMICKYLDEGYSKNIKNLFLKNPYGYFEYFKDLLSFNMRSVLFSKRLYVIKHYILFSYLTKQKKILKNVNGVFNKFLFVILYIPGIIKSYIYKKRTK